MSMVAWSPEGSQRNRETKAAPVYLGSQLFVSTLVEHSNERVDRATDARAPREKRIRFLHAQDLDDRVCRALQEAAALIVAGLCLLRLRVLPRAPNTVSRRSDLCLRLLARLKISLHVRPPLVHRERLGLTARGHVELATAAWHDDAPVESWGTKIRHLHSHVDVEICRTDVSLNMDIRDGNLNLGNVDLDFGNLVADADGFRFSKDKVCCLDLRLMGCAE
mmetsp:Transcript_17666/g.49286  ORF Transcript_17666/g.49286 Transcript_17666/m.49286 type:complete len:221 (+) Transcript_17666:44-706(+)